MRWTVRLGEFQAGKDKVTVSLTSHSHENLGRPGPYVEVVKNGKHYGETKVSEGVSVSLATQHAHIGLEM